MLGDHADLPTTIDLAVLTPRQRLVVVLHYFDNWSEREIAAGLGVTHQAVHDSLKLAVERLHLAALHL
jgi:DNA-directed RNA polymerase specialized sigma24 family protein